MKVVCALNDSSMLADHQRGRVADIESAYPLTVGRQYLILGMTITENILDYLVADDWGGPCFAPAGLFELATLPIPKSWKFRLRSGIRASGTELWADPCAAIWGYAELVDDLGHAAALEERDTKALAVFFSRIHEVEKELLSEEA